MLTDQEYMGQITALVQTLQGLKSEQSELQSLAQANKEKTKILFEPSLPGGWFYEHTLLEHISLFLSFCDLTGYFKDLIDTGQLFKTDFTSVEIEPPAWMTPDNDTGRVALMFVGLYTLHKSIMAIEAVAKPINQLIEAGRNGDRAALKLAIKLDPLAITSPTVAAEIMRSDVMDKGKFRTQVQSALRSPYRIRRVDHGVLRFVLKTMHDDGKLEKLTEADRYDFFCKRLAIYPDRNFEASDSLNRFIRHCVTSFRT